MTDLLGSAGETDGRRPDGGAVDSVGQGEVLHGIEVLDVVDTLGQVGAFEGFGHIGKLAMRSKMGGSC